MTTPAQVPEAPSAPAPQPRPAYIWLMRGGCYACIACCAAFGWWAPDGIIFDAIVATVVLVFALLRPTEGRLKAIRDIAVIAAVPIVFVLSMPVWAEVQIERVALALLAAVLVATGVVAAGAVLALRSVPKEVWAAQRPAPPPAIEPANVHAGLGWLARAIALIALLSPFVAAAYARQEAFFFFAGLLVFPYLVFLVNPVRRPWLAWGQALAVINAGLFVLPAVFSLMTVFEKAHLPRSDRAWIAFLAIFFLCQVALFFVVRRTYAARVAFGKEAMRGLLYYLCVLIFMAATLPDMVYPRRAANESSAAGALRTINTASYEYSNQYKGYPLSLKALGPAAAAGQESKDAAGFIDTQLATGMKSSYRFSYRPVVKDGIVVHYSVVARPFEYDETGTRSFFTDDSGTIRATSDDRDANANDPPL